MLIHEFRFDSAVENGSVFKKRIDHSSKFQIWSWKHILLASSSTPMSLDIWTKNTDIADTFLISNLECYSSKTVNSSTNFEVESLGAA